MIYADEPLANRLPQDWTTFVGLLLSDDDQHAFLVRHRPTRSGGMERSSLIPRCAFCAPLAYRTDRTGD